MDFETSDLDEIFRIRSLLYVMYYGIHTSRMSSGTTISSKTPEEDLEDNKVLDGL